MIFYAVFILILLNSSVESSPFLIELMKMSKKLEVSTIDMYKVIKFESAGTFSPSIKNKVSGATGLIQFMPKTAIGLGTTIKKLSKMTAKKQLDYVYKYMLPYKGRLKTLGDVYMAVLWPKAVGKLPSYVLWSKDTIYYRQNSGLDSNKDGKVTKKEATRLVRSK